MLFGNVRYSRGNVLTFNSLKQIRGLVWIKVKKCQLVERRKRESAEQSLNTYLEYLTTLSFAEYLYTFGLSVASMLKVSKALAREVLNYNLINLGRVTRTCYSCYLGIIHESLSLVSVCYYRRHQKGG